MFHLCKNYSHHCSRLSDPWVKQQSPHGAVRRPHVHRAVENQVVARDLGKTAVSSPSPPRALIEPLKSVWSLDHTTTLPPLPLTVASASIVAPACTVVWEASGTAGSAPCSPPPIKAVPPPLGPLTSILEPLFKVMSSATIWTWPPCVPCVAASSPEFDTAPPVAVRKMRPPRCTPRRPARSPYC